MNDCFLGEVNKRLQEILNNFFKHNKILDQQKHLSDYIITSAYVFNKNQIFPLFYIKKNTLKG